LTLNTNKNLLEGEELQGLFNGSSSPYAWLEVIDEGEALFRLKNPCTTPHLKEGRSHSIWIERENLSEGLIPLGPTLRRILPLEPPVVPVTFLTTDGKRLEFQLDNEEGWLEGEGAGGLLPDAASGDSLHCRLTVVDADELVFRLEQFWPQGGSEEGREKTEGKEEINFHLEGAKRLLQRLQESRFHNEASFSLHQRARGLRLRPGFDTLISEPALGNLEPFDYQRKTALRVLGEMRGRALLCDEVGLGKTIEAGLIMTEYIMRGLVNKVLILTPPSLVEQWYEEMRTKFNLDFVRYDSDRFEQAENGWQKFDRVVASLYTAKRKERRRYIEQIDYDMIIVDEAHHLKNKSTLNWKFVNRLKKKFILLLTATPVQNKLEELFNLITLLRPGQLATERSFKRKFITRGDRLKPKNTSELRDLLRDVMVRNKRSDHEIRLPDRYAQTLEVEAGEEERKFYRSLSDLVREGYAPQQEGEGSKDRIHKFVLKTLQREAGSSIQAVVPTLKKIRGNEISSSLQSRIDRLLNMASGIGSHAKVERLVQLVKKLEDRVIVFTAFRNTQKTLLERLGEEGVSTAQFHGQLRRAEKEEQIDRFKEEAQVLVSTESGGEGRNLQFCRRMINYDLPWNPMRIEQRIGRIHRIGQSRDVFIHNFSTRGTVESYILQLLDAKINMFELVIGELGMILGNLKESRDFEDVIMDIWARTREEEDIKKEVEEFGEELAEAKSEYDRVKRYDEDLFGDLLQQENDG